MTRTTVSDLARAVDEQLADLRGMKYWLLQKVAYDRTVSETLNAKLDHISLCCSVDPSTVPPMLEFPEELSRPWEPAEQPYEDDEE